MRYKIIKYLIEHYNIILIDLINCRHNQISHSFSKYSYDIITHIIKINFTLYDVYYNFIKCSYIIHSATKNDRSVICLTFNDKIHIDYYFIIAVNKKLHIRLFVNHKLIAKFNNMKYIKSYILSL